MMCVDFGLKNMEIGQSTITLEVPQSRQDKVRITTYAHRFIRLIKSGQAQKRIQSGANAMDSNN